MSSDDSMLSAQSHKNQSPRGRPRAVLQFWLEAYARFLAASDFAYLRLKRSTRPAVSTSFCLPVKNGWQFEQISRPMSPLWVERVVNTLPHAQCTRTSL